MHNAYGLHNSSDPVWYVLIIDHYENAGEPTLCDNGSQSQA